MRCFKKEADDDGGSVRVLFLALLLTLTFQGGLAQSEPDRRVPAVGDAYLAKDDGTGRPGRPVAEFSTTDIPIHCVFEFEPNGRSLVKMVFVAVDVVGVRPQTRVVTSTYQTTETQNRVNFTGRPEGRWTPGKYRVDLFVDNKLVTDIEFRIGPDPAFVKPKFVRSASSLKPKPAKGSTRPGN